MSQSDALRALAALGGTASVSEVRRWLATNHPHAARRSVNDNLARLRRSGEVEIAIASHATSRGVVSTVYRLVEQR